jgi:hypothetical protein
LASLVVRAGVPFIEKSEDPYKLWALQQKSVIFRYFP